LAIAVCEQYRKCERPATVLEVGAGTGAITRYLGSILRREDRLDVCEIQKDFADIIERDVLSRGPLASATAEGRVRLLRHAVQALSADHQYDFIISGLPLTAFELKDVEEVFGVIRRSLKPGGVFSYYEYIALRRTSRVLAIGKSRRRLKGVSRFLTKQIRAHEFERKAVLGNVPPAYARHLRFA
jgi:phospholipid N-methyltransferase